MKAVLQFQADGRGACLYTEMIDLRQLGRLQVVRATDIAFNDGSQLWETRHAETGQVLFSHPCRGECLRWEQENLHLGTPPAIQADSFQSTRTHP